VADPTIRNVAFPFDLTPMKAVLGELPADDDGWAYEVKWDGMRAMTYLDGDGGFSMRSTRRLEVVDRFPELAGLTYHLAGHRVVLDGEVVAFEPDGRTDFARLQHRMHVSDRSEATRRSAAVPVSYVAFDLLHLDGIDLTPLPYIERRRVLGELVEAGPSWQVPAHAVGGGAALLEAARERRLEGLMAKRLDSRYEPGRRSPTWRKVKVRRGQELVVGGWTTGEGSRAGAFGALLLGYHEPDDPKGALVYAGHVGTGFTGAELRRLRGLLEARATDTSPFRPPLPRLVVRSARWARPELVAQVAFGEWTPEGRLRHPSYLGLREDKRPQEVIREPVP